MQAMSIGQLAKSARVGVDTVRFYERHGLLPQPVRKASGYRQYSVDDARRLAFIRRAKELGFTLADIGELLNLQSHVDVSGRSVERIREVAQKKLLTVHAKIAELEHIRSMLNELVIACPGGGETDSCPILKAINRE